jgi:hypothetical protein
MYATGVSEFFRALDGNRVYDSHTPFILRTNPGTKNRIEFLRRYEIQRQGRLQPLPEVVRDYLAACPGSSTVN